MMRGETLLIFGHGVIGQGQLCPPARGCHALRCLVYTQKLNLRLTKVSFIYRLSFKSRCPLRRVLLVYIHASGMEF